MLDAVGVELIGLVGDRLPQRLPERPDLTFAAAYRPAYNVGGDFYDVVESAPDEFYFASLPALAAAA